MESYNRSLFDWNFTEMMDWEREYLTRMSNMDEYKCDLTAWSHLSKDCQIQKAIFLFVSVLTTASVHFGNLYAIIVLITSGLFKEPSIMIGLLLSVADLLMLVFPVTLAVCRDIGVLSGQNLFSSFDTFGYNIFIRMTDITSMISLITFHSVSTVYVLCIFLLSFNSLLMAMNTTLKQWHVILCTAFIWVLGITFPVCGIILEGDKGAISLDSITMLAIFITYTEAYKIMQILHLIAGVLSVIFTVVSVIMTIIKHHKTKQDLKSYPLKNQSQNQQQLLRISVAMQVLFVIAAIPPLVDMKYFFGRRNPYIHYFCWWIFIFASSCHWMIYAYAGRKYAKNKARYIFLNGNHSGTNLYDQSDDIKTSKYISKETESVKKLLFEN